MSVHVRFRRLWAAGALLCAAALVGYAAATGVADDGEPTPDSGANAAPPALKPGLSVNDPRAWTGYTLLAPMTSPESYLIDMEGRVVKTWEFGCNPALSACLLKNGHVLRPGALPFGESKLNGPGAGGRIMEMNWDGEVVWDYRFANDRQLQHHDVCSLPNGNVLMVIWDLKTKDEALAAGRREAGLGDQLLADGLVEVRPTGLNTGEIVWEWHAWDHLVQEVDKSRPNYGRVAAHPELIDLNYGEQVVGQMLANKDDADKLRSIGYVGNSPPPPAGAAQAPGGGPPGGGPPGGPGFGAPPGMGGDWTHFNSVAYRSDLDQIVVSVHAYSEIWIIDHGTTTSEAASHKGGPRGRGGDLLYRWGNPRAYRSGTNVDQRLFSQHNAHWIPEGLPGAGHLLVFNNGSRRPDGMYSSVDEIIPPLNADGSYDRPRGLAFGPDAATWTYQAPEKSEFYSMLISGSQRLTNGNTLICSGISGTVFEVTPDGETVWKYVNPIKGSGFPGGGPPGPGRPGGRGFPGGPFTPPPVGTVLPSFLQDALRLSDEQKKTVDAFQQGVVEEMGSLLTDEQRESLRDPTSFDFRQIPAAGEIFSQFMRDKLKLSDEQGHRLDELQMEVDEKLAALLDDGQRQQLDVMKTFSRGGPPGFGPPGGGPGGFVGGPPRPGLGGPPGGPDLGLGGPGFGVPAPGSSLFRSYRYAADYAGLAGRELNPGETLEEVERAAARRREAAAGNRRRPPGDRPEPGAPDGPDGQTAK